MDDTSDERTSTATLITEFISSLNYSLEIRSKAFKPLCDQTNSVSKNGWDRALAALHKVVIAKIDTDDIIWYNYVELLLKEKYVSIIITSVNICDKGMLELLRKYSCEQIYMESLCAGTKIATDEFAFAFDNGIVPNDNIFSRIVQYYDDRKFEILKLFFDYFEARCIKEFEHVLVGDRTLRGLKYWIERGGDINKLRPHDIMIAILRKKGAVVSFAEEFGYDFSILNSAWEHNDYLFKTIDRLGINLEAVNAYYAKNFE